jgi:D-threo-aldose 1-dehydrogenase
MITDEGAQAAVSERPDAVELVLGGAPLGGLFAAVSDADADAVLAAAWEAGIRSFDTAPHYGLGLSEQRMGRLLSSLPREQFAVSTKVGRLLVPAAEFVDGADGYYGTPPLQRVYDYSADGVRRSVESSLDRLGLDRVDQLLIHDPDRHWRPAVAEAYPELERMRSEGLVKHIGVGMNQVPMLQRFVAETEIDCVMIAGRYTLLDRSAAPLLELCADRGVDVIVAGVFNSGVLAAPSTGATFDYAPAPPAVLDRARELGDICRAHGVELPAAALRFAARNAAVRAVVVGVRSAAELTQNARYWHTALPERLWGDLGA